MKCCFYEVDSKSRCTRGGTSEDNGSENMQAEQPLLISQRSDVVIRESLLLPPNGSKVSG